MTQSFQDGIEDLANDLREQGADLRVDNFVSFIYTSDVMNRYLDRELRKHGYNRTLMNILHNLVTHDGTMTPTELGKRVYRSDHAMTRAIDILHKEGLVEREGVAEDRRLRKVTITRKGLNLVKKGMTDRKALTFRVMSCLDKGEAETFSAILKRLRKHLFSLLENSTSQR
jgi:DNA-binding MarR family transcriptional regulator